MWNRSFGICNSRHAIALPTCRDLNRNDYICALRYSVGILGTIIFLPYRFLACRSVLVYGSTLTNNPALFFALLQYFSLLMCDYSQRGDVVVLKSVRKKATNQLCHYVILYEHTTHSTVVGVAERALINCHSFFLLRRIEAKRGRRREGLFRGDLLCPLLPL